MGRVLVYEYMLSDLFLVSVSQNRRYGATVATVGIPTEIHFSIYHQFHLEIG